MQVKILVTVDIEDIEPIPDLLPQERRAAVREAIAHAVQYGEQNGFCHSLDSVTSIQVISVEEVDRDD